MWASIWLLQAGPTIWWPAVKGRLPTTRKIGRTLMASNDIHLTAGIRNNLLLLQQTSSLLDRTQQRLATGNRVNTALDGPVSYFASKGLTQRSDDLNLIKDQMDQSVSTIKTADTAVTSIEG